MSHSVALVGLELSILLPYPPACWDCRPVPSIASASVNSRVFVSFPERMYHNLQWPLCIVITMIFSDRMEELEARQNAPESNQTFVCYSVVESIFSFLFSLQDRVSQSPDCPQIHNAAEAGHELRILLFLPQACLEVHFSGMHVCMPHAFLMSTEARIRCEIPWNWSCRQV